jgi:hypothetical protein
VPHENFTGIMETLQRRCAAVKYGDYDVGQLRQRILEMHDQGICLQEIKELLAGRYPDIEYVTITFSTPF